MPYDYPLTVAALEVTDSSRQLNPNKDDRHHTGAKALPDFRE
jgi:hypothetical protein